MNMYTILEILFIFILKVLVILVRLDMPQYYLRLIEAHEEN